MCKGNYIAYTHFYLVRRRFVLCITGSVSPGIIEISFLDEDEYGAISVHTCSKEIHFPRTIFANEDEETYKMFSNSLMAVIDSKTFNTV